MNVLLFDGYKNRIIKDLERFLQGARLTEHKRQILERYVTLFRMTYDGVKRSGLNNFRIFRCRYAKRLGRKLVDSTPNGVNNVKMNMGTYRFVDHEIYVNFANSNLGGGVLGNGFVQEEFILTQSNALPFFVKSLAGFNKICDSYNLKGTPQASRHLRGPLILDLTLLFDIPQGLYGHGKTFRFFGETAKSIKPLNSPIQILFAAMPAPKFHNTARYNAAIVDDMTTRAFSTFLASWKVFQHKKFNGSIPAGKKFVVHSGRWGCGAFNNNPEVSFIIQMCAWSMLMNHLSSKGHHPDIDCQLVLYQDTQPVMTDYRQLIAQNKSLRLIMYDEISKLNKFFRESM